MIPLTSEDVAFYESQKYCCICGKAFCCDKKQEKRFKLYKKVRDLSFYRKIRGAAYSICNLHYKVPQEIPVKFRNGSISVPIKKERDNSSGEAITYKTKFIDTCRFMSSKLLNLLITSLKLIIMIAKHA